jgi:hypothetical protein
MENLDALLANPYSSNLLLSVSGCSTTLRRSFSGLFFYFPELKEFFSSLCLSAHWLNALLVEYEEPSMILASI